MSDPRPGGRYFRDKETGEITPEPKEQPVAEAPAPAATSRRAK